MAQISKRIAAGDFWEMLYKRLISLVGELKTKQRVTVFLGGILSDTEKKMISKRIMAGFLLLSDWEVHKIAEVLKLSSATVYKLKYQIELNPEYKKLLQAALPKAIPYKEETRMHTSSALVKLVENIFEGKLHRSKLIYG